MVLLVSYVFSESDTIKMYAISSVLIVHSRNYLVVNYEKWTLVHLKQELEKQEKICLLRDAGMADMTQDDAKWYNPSKGC